MSLNSFRFAVYVTGIVVGMCIGAETRWFVLVPALVISPVLVAMFQGSYERRIKRDALQKGRR